MQVGLICGAGGYLTAGRYGDGVTALGSSLGKKQTWKLKVTTKQGEQTVVELIGHQGQPLLVDADGTVRCAPPVSEQQRQFLLEVHPSGAWTLQHVHSRKYLESDGEDVFCITRGLASYHRWMPQLAMHVHVVLFNPSAQLYARADPELNRVWVDTPVPYLEECSFILRFRSGVYHLETSNHREGRILYPHGSRGLLCLGDNPADNEEWFVIQRCPQWVSLRTRTKRYMTIICDSEVYAGSKKVTPMSVFHLEVNSGAKTVQLKGINHSYLAQRECKSVVADGCCREPETSFHVLWHYGKTFLRACNGRYLGTLPVGLVVARAVHPGPNEEFRLRLANRSFVMLRGRYGYVGSSGGHRVLRCNLLEPDCIELLPCKRGVYHLQTRGKSFWSLTSEKTFKTWGKFALNFCLEIRGNNLLAILAPNGYYLRGDREGALVADSEEVTGESIWEF